MREDGYISVVNTGLKNGKIKVDNGKGKRTRQQGLLRVSFFWPFYSDYLILWVDENYQHALVGGDSAEYLWILARTPTINASIKNTILTEAKRRGYDIDKLIWVEQ
jgi:lipocalin